MRIEGGVLISNIKQISGRIFEHILAEKKIDAFNGAQGRILYVLWQDDGISQREIADRTGLAATTLTSMIDRMERAGLVKRTPAADDRRKTLLVLTDRARKLEADYNEVSERMTQIFYRGFSEAEVIQCEEYLKRILHNFREA